MNNPIELTVEGMTCGHCERAVTQAVKRIDPQAQVTIDRAIQRVTISNNNAALPELISAITEEGYRVSPASRD